jgi:hypothetical protein
MAERAQNYAKNTQDYAKPVSAANALYPHLRSQAPHTTVAEPLHTANSVAAAMYPTLVKSAPKRTPADLKAWAEAIRRL